MKLGIISDLHSNIYALDAVLPELAAERIDHLIILGDLFGYYPWAHRTWERLQATPWPTTMIKGNHDEMLITQQAAPAYVESITQNRADLYGTTALAELAKLPFAHTFVLGGQTLHLVHGTPPDPENGRYYPDDTSTPAWLPPQGHWLLLGHTHYPFARHTEQGGILLNPGSVGQPRDGDPRAAFAIIDLTQVSYSLQRVTYDVSSTQVELQRLGWNERAIRALDKRHAGSLSPA